MSIVRMIYTKFPPSEAAEAEKDWREECGPLMKRQPGCISEELLRCTESAGEYISYSEWTDTASIDAYLRSADHQEIKRRTRGIKDASVTVKTYEVIP
jgi:heme-degrading monooxygenase HmoA